MRKIKAYGASRSSNFVQVGGAPKIARIAKFRCSNPGPEVYIYPIRRRPRVRKHLERDLQQNIFHMLSKYPGIRKMATASANGEKRSKSTGAVLKSMGVTAGWPDIQIMIPVYCENLKGWWHGFFYECKAPGKKPTPHQRELLHDLGQHLYYAVCGDSLEDFETHMGHYFGSDWRDRYVAE